MMSHLSIKLKAPCKKPKQYSGAVHSIRNGATVYDFYSAFGAAELPNAMETRAALIPAAMTLESATTPPPFMQNDAVLMGENVEENREMGLPQDDSHAAIYVKLPRDLYDKVMRILKERTSAVQELAAESSLPTTRGQSKRSRATIAAPLGHSSTSSWSDEEDRFLMTLVKTHGKHDWDTVASELGTARTAKACRDRYHNQLDPQIKRGDWSAEEDAMIIELHETLGNQWTQIAKQMHGRTANTIKNRWHGHLKKQFMNNGAAPAAAKKGNLALTKLGAPTPHITSGKQQISITFTASTPTPADEAAHPHYQMHNMNAAGAHHAAQSTSSLQHHGEAPPFSNDFAHNFFGNQEPFFKLDSSGETCSDTSSEFASHDVASHHNIFGLSPSPKKRKRDTEEFFVVGKRIKLETAPENLDLSVLYADDGNIEEFVDPLQFDVNTPVNGTSIKRAPRFESLMIDVPRMENEDQYHTPGQVHVYPAATVQGSGGDRSTTSGGSHNNTSYDMLSLTISPSNMGAKDLSLWSPKSSVEIYNHSPSKHFLRLGSHL